MRIVIPGITSLIALVFAVALVDQWRVRRHAFQLSWAIGMLFFGIASGCEAIAAASGWSEPLYRTWYLAGAVWTAGQIGEVVRIERVSLPAAAVPCALPQDERQGQRARREPGEEPQEGFGGPIERVGRQRVGRPGRT